MALKAFSELEADECVAHAEVEDAVATGQLLWSGSNPGLAPGYCYTRDDFETYIRHRSMASSGIAPNELMTRSEMEAYRTTGAAITSDTPHSEWVLLPGGDWRGWLSFSVNTATKSVGVQISINGSAFGPATYINVTPGSSGNETAKTQVGAGQTLSIRLTPYTENNGGGVAGSSVTNSPTEPA